MLMRWFCCLVIRRPPRSTRTDTLFPYPTLFRSAVAIGARLAGREHRDFFEQITVAVEVHPEIGATADIARQPVAQPLARVDRAAAIRLHILIAGVDGQDEAIGQGEARRAADIARVRRIVATVEFGAATVG